MASGDRIRVLYYYPYLSFDTGSPKALAQFIDTLDRRIFEPVFCARGDGPLPRALAARGVEIVPGAAASISARHPVAALAAIRRQMARLRAWRIDVVHANTFDWNTDLILAAWALRTPVILHVHNPLNIALQNLERLAARKVLFCSQFEMGNCGHVGRIAGKTDVVYNVIDTTVFERSRAIRASLGIPDGAIAIGTVAQVVHRKGIDVFLDAARQLLRERDDLVFVVAGPVMESEREFGDRMLAAADEPELRGHVRFLGPRSDIPDVLASLDLFVLASRAEPLGIVVLEAMATGLPVIASRVGGIPEMLTSPDVGTLVEPITAGAFAAAIRDVLARPDRGRAMGAAGRATLAGKFDLATGGERLKRIYFEVLGRAA